MGALRNDLIAALCSRPCRAAAITRSERRLMPDGTEVVSGDLPPRLCDACPERASDVIRHIELLHGFPPGRDVWDVGDIESAAPEGEGTVRIRILYDPH